MQEKSLLEPIPQKKDDLSKLSVSQLKERLWRQEKLLTNPSFVARLPDKGARIHEHVANLRAFLDSQLLLDDATKHLEAMSLETRAAGTSTSTGTGASTSASASVSTGASTSEGPHPMLTQARHTVVDRSSTADPTSSEGTPERHSEASTASVDGGAGEGPAKPSAAPASHQKHRPAKDIAAVRERVAQTVLMRSKVLSLEESSELLQGQEKRLKALERKYAEERLKKLVGKHDVGQLPSSLPPEFQRHRGAVTPAAQSVGDRQQQKMTSLQQSFVGDVDVDDVDDDDDDVVDDDDNGESSDDNVDNAADDDDLDSVD